jgi:hypothetical protein
MLPVLAEYTNSQIAAVYLLREDKKTFYHYESVGLSAVAANYTFDADCFQAEFGRAYLPGKSETSPAEISSYR